MFYYTYVLLSLKDNRPYIGCAQDLRKRFDQHISGKVEATKNKLPLKLIYYEACLDKTKAFKRERYFKTGCGRRFIDSRI